MCGRYTLTTPLEGIRAAFEVEAGLNLMPRYNIAPTQEVVAIRSAAEGGRELVFLRWGLVPVWGLSVRLPERVGLSTAKELMFTSRRITGVEAAEIGLVDHAVPADELDDRVDALAAEIVANSWGTNRIDKKLLRDATRMSRNDALINERLRPYGAPEDMAERMKGPKKR